VRYLASGSWVLFLAMKEELLNLAEKERNMTLALSGIMLYPAGMPHIKRSHL